MVEKLCASYSARERKNKCIDFFNHSFLNDGSDMTLGFLGIVVLGDNTKQKINRAIQAVDNLVGQDGMDHSRIASSEILEKKFERSIFNASILSGDLFVIHGKFSRVRDAQRSIRITPSKSYHKIRCGIEYKANASDRAECYGTFYPSTISYE